MRKSYVAGSVLVVFGAASWWWTSRGRAGDAASAAPPTARQSIELTVYKEDFGMVREARPVQLTQGSNKLRVPEVSRQLDPQSVMLSWQGGKPNAPQLVAHAYDLGVNDTGALLKRYLGQEVELVQYGNNGYEAERKKGKLMAQSGGAVVLESDDKFYVGPPGTVVAPTNPDIVTIPQLSVQAESQAAQSANLEVTYLTRGLSWSADYVATLSPTDDSLKLECWATVTNRTGADYPSAKVTLMAGTPNRAVQSAPAREARGRRFDANTIDVSGSYWKDGHNEGKAEMPALLPPIRQEAVGDAHAYRLANPTTVVQEQMNRLLMLSGEKVSVLKDYSVQPPALTSWDYEDYVWGTPARPGRRHAQVALAFFNREKEGLGAPLPQGAIRIYEPDSTGSLRYAGAASIPDTPKDQKVNITLANAFDVFVEWRLVKRQKVNKKTIRKQVELTLHNEKATPVTLRVSQSFLGGWKVVSASHKHTKMDSARAEWKVPLPANGKITLAYTVDLSY